MQNDGRSGARSGDHTHGQRANVAKAIEGGVLDAEYRTYVGLLSHYLALDLRKHRILGGVLRKMDAGWGGSSIPGDDDTDRVQVRGKVYATEADLKRFATRRASLLGTAAPSRIVIDHAVEYFAGRGRASWPRHRGYELMPLDDFSAQLLLAAATVSARAETPSAQRQILRQEHRPLRLGRAFRRSHTNFEDD